MNWKKFHQNINYFLSCSTKSVIVIGVCTGIRAWILRPKTNKLVFGIAVSYTTHKILTLTRSQPFVTSFVDDHLPRDDGGRRWCSRENLERLEVPRHWPRAAGGRRKTRARQAKYLGFQLGPIMTSLVWRRENKNPVILGWNIVSGKKAEDNVISFWLSTLVVPAFSLVGQFKIQAYLPTSS